jgi:hypothetical protein
MDFLIAVRNLWNRFYPPPPTNIRIF